jgi:hypothetical protein
MQLEFMENLLRIEAEAKYFLGATDRDYEQKLMDELSTIIEYAEYQLGPRDRSYELLPPRISECGCAHPYIYPFRKIRIYLTSHAADRFVAARQLAHEAVHVLGPTPAWTTVLEEGLGERFAESYMKRVYKLPVEAPNRWYDAAKHAVAPLLAQNEFVIKELREHQPQISKFDQKLLVEVAGIGPDHAKLLCTNFESSWLTASTWNEYAVQGAQTFAKGAKTYYEGARAFYDAWKSIK